MLLSVRWVGGSSGVWLGESVAGLVSCYPPVAVRGPYPGGPSGVCALGEREERKQRREKEGKGGKEGEGKKQGAVCVTADRIYNNGLILDRI